MPSDQSITWQDFVGAKRSAIRAARAEQKPQFGPLVPNPDLPLSETVVYQTVAISSLPEVPGQPVELEGAIDLLSGTLSAPTGAAEGVMLTHEQSWHMKGVTLGKLLYSLCLAPGEVTQVAVTEWQRSTSGTSSQQLEAQESSSQSADRSRAVTEVTQMVANETQSGGSSTSSLAEQTSGGVDFGFVNASASSNFAVASSVNFNLGSRSLSADSNESVRQATQQYAANARGQRSGLVQEVVQSETEQFSSRVVANYNHMHALNMLYFEVLQVFELSTRVTGAQRCLFLPMQVITFDAANATGFAPQLAKAAEAMGLPGLAQALRQLQAGKEVAFLARLKAEADQAGVNAQSALTAFTDATKLTNAPMDLAMALNQFASSITAQAEAQARLVAELEASAHSTADIIRQLNDRKLAFNQALWSQLDPTQVAAMIGSKRHRGSPLLETMDPNPIAVTGNFVGFRWNFPAGQEEQAQEFLDQHLSDDDMDVSDRDTVVLPTGGVFAEAVLGRANSAEKLDLTRFWRWDDKTIPILPTAISELQQIRRDQLAEAKPGTFGDPVVKAQTLPDFPAGPSHAMASMLGASLFRDLSGSDVIEETLKTAQEAAKSGSVEAMTQAQESVSALLDHVEKMLPTVADALKKGGNLDVSNLGGLLKDGKLDTSNLGALQNVLGKEGAAIDVESLLGSAAELGLFL